jgi:hypothetical protein
MSKLYITKAQFAAAKNICLRTLDKWMYGRVIPFIKIGRLVRLDPQKCDAALEEFEQRSISDTHNGGGAK